MHDKLLTLSFAVFEGVCLCEYRVSAARILFDNIAFNPFTADAVKASHFAILV